jgi:hypothetical protein
MEAKIVARDLGMDIDVYKADHHGAGNGSSQVLLDGTRPTVIVISNGSRADYRHPRETTLAQMQDLAPAPTIFQTNTYRHAGGNVPDPFIADLEALGADGTILITVDLAAGNYVVTYRSQSHTFPIKQHTTAGVVIESLLPNPLGSDGLRRGRRSLRGRWLAVLPFPLAGGLGAAR